MAVIWGLCGFKNAGKSSSGNYIQGADSSTELLSFAGPLKDAVAPIFGWRRALLEGDTEESRTWREQEDEYWSGVFGRSITPRIVLQEVGTQVFREGYHPDIWIAAVERRVRNHQAMGRSVCLTDCRFLNEMQMIRRLGGMILWIRRRQTDPLLPSRLVCSLPYYDQQPWALYPELAVGLEGHPSEVNFLREGAGLIDVIVENDGTMEDLEAQIHRIVKMGPTVIQRYGHRYFSRHPFSTDRSYDHTARVLENDIDNHILNQLKE